MESDRQAMSNDPSHQFDVEQSVLLALDLFHAQCFESLSNVCEQLPPACDMKLSVAMRLLAQRHRSKGDVGDPSASFARSAARLTGVSAHNTDELLAMVLAVLSESPLPAPPAPSASAEVDLSLLPPPPVPRDLTDLPPAPPITAPHTTRRSAEVSDAEERTHTPRPAWAREVRSSASPMDSSTAPGFAFSRIAQRRRTQTITDFSRHHRVDIVWLLAVANDLYGIVPPWHAMTELNPEVEGALWQLLAPSHGGPMR